MRIFLTILLLSFIKLGFCQSPYFLTIDKTSGLPSNSVYDIFQDSKGFMWFANGNGLSRYDGNKFKTFTSDEQTSKSGSCIAEDIYGRIWYANFDGYLYYVEKNVLKALKQPTSLGYFRFGIIKNELFLVQPNSVLVYDLKSLKIKKNILLSDKTIRFCYANAEKFYVLGDYLHVFSNSNSYKKYELPKVFYNEIVSPIVNYWNQKLVIISKGNSTFYTFKNGVFTKSKLNFTTKFNQNTAVVDNFIWVCTPNGVYKSDISNPSTAFFKDQNISYVFKDKYQNYWISTLNKGVLFIENFGNTYVDLPHKPMSISEGKNCVYVGADKNLIYKIDSKNLLVTKIYETESNHAVNQIFADTVNDKLSFTSFRFNILNKKNQVTSEFPIAVKEVKKVDDKYFSFAASSVSGIFFIDKKLNSSWDLFFEKNKLDKFSGFNQVCILKQTNGKSTEYLNENNTIYYATNNGLIATNNNGKKIEIKHNNKILYLTKIQKYQNIIIGLSTNEKLYEINAKNQVSIYNLPDNLAHQKINRFSIIDNFCYLFVSNGVYEFNFKTKKAIKILSSSKELEATDVVLKNGKLFFVTSKGIVIKNKTAVGNYPKPKLIINEIQVNENRKERTEIQQLKSNENDITINYSTLSYIPYEKYSVSYKINNSEWKILDASSENLKLSSLASGNYTVLLAINFNNQKTAIQKITFAINKPFWQTNLFIGVLIFTILTLFYAFYKHQIKKIERQNQMLLEKNELEKNLNLSTLKAIKSQMNPHFFYNALNTIQSYILANDKKQAVNYLSKFSSLTRNILEMTEKEFVSIAEEINTLSLYLDIEKARFNEDFEYEIKTDSITDLENQKIPAMLLQPYVENAVKHGLLHKNGLKKLVIYFSKIDKKIRIEIDDNGIGRQKSNKLNAIKNKNHNSFATSAMQNRIDLLNKNKTNKITIDFHDKLNPSNQSLGTTVIIEIQLG